jgi:hypothetical protein
MTVFHNRRDSTVAQESPAGPAPIINTSVISFEVGEDSIVELESQLLVNMNELCCQVLSDLACPSNLM